ncbi:sugar transferase [Flavobacterium sp.]|jgi:lipopolysaccharide/colanic/teichoic acid biosynthesis glycosyltransferase|uniref:sugar transferase n=1 Tax=Flavobacterium sp. TaxID=239 RepID=UPI0037C18EA9
MYKFFLKPLFDFIFAFVGLLFLSPIFIIGFVLLYFANDGKPFFFQIRPGKKQRLFRIIKFKTMNDKTDAQGKLLSDDQRLTKIGKFVRKTSLDELPQLLNVLMGDMSLIGPRPLLPEYLPLYSRTQNRRHDVKPGITGWAQVNGRNAISWQQKFEFDVWYVDNVDFELDFRIFVKTIQKTIKSEGINPDNMTYTEDFNGHN